MNLMWVAFLLFLIVALTACGQAHAADTVTAAATYEPLYLLKIFLGAVVGFCLGCGSCWVAEKLFGTTGMVVCIALWIAAFVVF